MFSLPGMLRVVINEDFVFVVVVFFSVRREKQCNVTCSKISLSSSWEKVGCYANVISLLIVLSCLYSVHWPALCVGFSFEGGGGGLIKIKTVAPQWAAEVLPSQTSCDFIINFCGYTIQCCKAHTKPIAMLATIVRFCIQKMNLLKGVVDLVLLASTFVNNHMTMVYEYVGKKASQSFAVRLCYWY